MSYLLVIQVLIVRPILDRLCARGERKANVILAHDAEAAWRNDNTKSCTCYRGRRGNGWHTDKRTSRQDRDQRGRGARGELVVTVGRAQSLK